MDTHTPNIEDLVQVGMHLVTSGAAGAPLDDLEIPNFDDELDGDGEEDAMDHCGDEDHMKDDD